MGVEVVARAEHSEPAESTRVAEPHLVMVVESPDRMYMRGGSRGLTAQEHLAAHAQLNHEEVHRAMDVASGNRELLAAAEHIDDFAGLEQISGRKLSRRTRATAALSREAAGGIARGDQHVAPEQSRLGDAPADDPGQERQTHGFNLGEFGHNQA